jgi:hypothetical protein
LQKVESPDKARMQQLVALIHSWEQVVQDVIGFMDGLALHS